VCVAGTGFAVVAGGVQELFFSKCKII